MPADLQPIATRHGITLIVQFGSSVSGRTHAKSDVDLAVLVEERSLPFDELAALQHSLQEHFPEGQVDLVELRHADPLLYKQILEQGRLVYGSTALFEKLRIYAFKRYQDHRRFLDLERQYVRRTIETLTS